MSGVMLYSSPNTIQYAFDAISGGYTKSLLSAFTEVSGATLAAGDRMHPKVSYPLGSSEPTYIVNAGTYTGVYYVNRNHVQGENYYNYWLSTNEFNIDQFHDYQHWPPDQRLALDVRNVTPWIYDFSIKITGYGGLCDLNAYSPADYNFAFDYYTNLPNSSGAFDPGAVNTGWTLIITVGCNSGNPPGAAIMWDIDCRDYHTGDQIYTSYGPTIGTGTPGSPFGYTQVINIYVDYWRCPTFRMIAQ
jgi:hypothetical protein